MRVGQNVYVAHQAYLIANGSAVPMSSRFQVTDRVLNFWIKVTGGITTEDMALSVVATGYTGALALLMPTNVAASVSPLSNGYQFDFQFDGPIEITANHIIRGEIF